MTYTYNLNGFMIEIDDTVIDIARKSILGHKHEFDGYLTENSPQKLQAVKSLKEYAGLGLKESKNFIDLYYSGKIKLISITEERQKKLEQLAKSPLVQELVDRIKNTDEEKLHSLFMNLDIENLFIINETLEKNLNNK